jgi:predicted transcriptional regulator
LAGTLFPPLIGKNRSLTEIAATILAVAQDGETQVRIMKESRLSSRRLRFYLEELVRLGLIETSSASGSRIYTTNEKGFQYLMQYKRISDLLK